MFWRLGSFFLARCWPSVSNNAAWPAVSPEIRPRFPRHGAGNRAPISGKTSPPEIGAQFGPRVGGIEPATFRLQASVCLQLGQVRVASTAIHLHLLHGHHTRPRPDRNQNPKSMLQTGRLDFGFWGLDFGVWISDFGFWILVLFFVSQFASPANWGGIVSMREADEMVISQSYQGPGRHIVASQLAWETLEKTTLSLSLSQLDSGSVSSTFETDAYKIKIVSYSIYCRMVITSRTGRYDLTVMIWAMLETIIDIQQLL